MGSGTGTETTQVAGALLAAFEQQVAALEVRPDVASLVAEAGAGFEPRDFSDAGVPLDEAVALAVGLLAVVDEPEDARNERRARIAADRAEIERLTSDPAPGPAPEPAPQPAPQRAPGLLQRPGHRLRHRLRHRLHRRRR